MYAIFVDETLSTPFTIQTSPPIYNRSYGDRWPGILSGEWGDCPKSRHRLHISAKTPDVYQARPNGANLMCIVSVVTIVIACTLHRLLFLSVGRYENWILFHAPETWHGVERVIKPQQEFSPNEHLV